MQNEELSVPRSSPVSHISALTPDSFRLMVESVQDYAIFMLDSSGHVLTWNKGAQTIKGYTADEIIGQHFSAFYSQSDLEAGKPEMALHRAIKEGRIEDEGWRLRKDGSRFWANVILTALFDESGRLQGFGKVTRDLTAKREAAETARELVREQAARAAAEEAEVRIRQERERYKALSRRLEVILEGVADGITVQEREGRLIYANRAAAHLCGFESPEELLDAPPQELLERFVMLDEDGAPFDPMKLPGRRVLLGEDAASATIHVRERASDRDWWTVIRTRPVKSEDGLTDLAINVIHDVTADRRHDEHEKYITKATTVLASSLDYGAMLRSLAQIFVPGMADWCTIHLLEGDELVNVAVSHADPARAEKAREHAKQFPIDRSRPRGIWNVVRTGQSEIYANVTDEMLQQGAQSPEHLELLRATGMRSVIIVPLRVRDRLLGTITLVAAESPKRFNQLDVSLAEELGRRAGVALENAKLYAAETSLRAQFELIARAGETFVGTLDYEATLRNVVEICLPALGDFAFFDVLEGNEVRRVAHAFNDPEVDALISETRWVRSERTDINLCALSSGVSGLHPHIDEAWRLNVAANPGHLELLRKIQLVSMITVPMSASGGVKGSLTLCFGKSGRHHTVEDLKLAEELARRAGIAVTQARLYAEAQTAAKAAEDASRVKDEFLATVSHELRTPLNAIVGWSSLLRDRNTDPALEKGLEVIHRNAQAQGKIIDDILDVSRIITGKLRLELRQTDLCSIIRDAIEVVRPSASAKRIAVEFSPPKERCMLVADSERLQQVVWNLLANAIKFTNADGVVTVAIDRDDGRLSVCVSDTGAGIDPEFLPYVFDRFKQADGSTTRRVGGLGLGLAIVRHLTELHGGRVSATSPGLGKGATFTVALPVRALVPDTMQAKRTLARQQTADAREASPSVRDLKVLVVDDEPDARELIQSLLEDAGAEAQTAGSAAEAFELLRHFRADVLISDIGMPTEDGYTLMRRIRMLEPNQGGSIPSIALTAYARAEDRRRALGAGFTTHIGKPVNPDDLLLEVANLGSLSQKRTERHDT